jgi:outer membrane receptor protein involved in Fe transport
VYDPVTPSIKYYTNISEERHQGFELIAEANKENAFGIADLSGSCSYTFLKAENCDTDIAESTINKGGRLADIPAHQFQADMRADFKTGTSVDLFGSYTANAVKYVMKSNPASTDEFSTDYYATVKLHDPLFVTLKISQKLFEKYELYVACKNIFDDYAADPFNPGAGRQFVFGAKGEI